MNIPAVPGLYARRIARVEGRPLYRHPPPPSPHLLLLPSPSITLPRTKIARTLAVGDDILTIPQREAEALERRNARPGESPPPVPRWIIRTIPVRVARSSCLFSPVSRPAARQYATLGSQHMPSARPYTHRLIRFIVYAPRARSYVRARANIEILSPAADIGAVVAVVVAKGALSPRAFDLEGRELTDLSRAIYLFACYRSLLRYNIGINNVRRN